jgi:hypothetical protein
MESLFLIGGTLLLIGGFAQLWIAAQSYRQGRPWRGSGLTALAMTVYGGLTAMGLVFNGTIVGTSLIWLFAALAWAGLWLSRRDHAGVAR